MLNPPHTHPTHPHIPTLLHITKWASFTMIKFNVMALLSILTRTWLPVYYCHITSLFWMFISIFIQISHDKKYRTLYELYMVANGRHAVLISPLYRVHQTVYRLPNMLLNEFNNTVSGLHTLLGSKFRSWFKIDPITDQSDFYRTVSTCLTINSVCDIIRQTSFTGQLAWLEMCYCQNHYSSLVINTSITCV